MKVEGLPIATQPRKFFSTKKGSTLSERSEFVIPPVKGISEGSRRPSCRAGFLLLLFFARQRKVERDTTGFLEDLQKPVFIGILIRLQKN
jgi:hypothetical protein